MTKTGGNTGNYYYYYYGARYYDPQVSVWLSVDPLAHLSLGQTPYHFVSNNPVIRVDPNGQKDILVGEDGSHQGTENDNWWHNLWHGTRGVLLDSDGNEKLKFKFADPENDIERLKNGEFIGVEIVSDKDIQRILTESGVYTEEAQKNPASYADREGNDAIREGVIFDHEKKGSGKMDYPVNANVNGEKLAWQTNKLFIANSSSGYYAHNSMNFGNFLWGAGMRALGIHYRGAATAAHAHNLIYEWPNKVQLDSKDDQRSIQLGYYWNNPKARKSFQWLR